MSYWMRIFKVRPGEGRMASILTGLMLITALGGAAGGSAIEALFFARFGVSLLPLMYILLGLLAFIASLGITALMGRVDNQRLYASLPFLLGLFLVGERLLMLVDVPWLFAAIWLTMNVINTLLGLLCWGLAGAACDTRQAKRLFPLFSAGAILGTVIGGLMTPFLAGWLHAENLVLLWALTLFVSFVLARALTGPAVASRAISHLPQPGITDEMQQGYRFVRGSPVLRWISYSSILFSVCFYALALPFSRGAAAQYPNADQLAGFLGFFTSLYTGAALLASLFIANRLFARFGILPMLLVLPIIYLAGFGMMAAAASFATASFAFSLLVVFRFAQMAYLFGIAGTSWQAIFNVVPPEQREQVRAFVSGVPEQAGTFIAGLALLVGDKTLPPQQLYLVGLLAAALTVYFIWRASRAYSQALVDALHAGQPHIFPDEDQSLPALIPTTARLDPAPFDAWAIATAIRGLQDPDAGMRRVSAEMISQVPVHDAAPALIHALADADAQVKIAALKGLARAHATQALVEISACLSDPDADVRFQAVEALRQLAPYPPGIEQHLESLLADPSPAVRVQAALSLVGAEAHPRARDLLIAMTQDASPAVRALALNALGICRDGSAARLALAALGDAQVAVRRAAIRALAATDPQAALGPFIQQLSDEDRSIRATLAAAFRQIGAIAVEPLVETLDDPSRAEGALMALEYLPVEPLEQRIRSYAGAAAQSALRYHRLAAGMAQQYTDLSAGDGPLQLLFDSLEHQGRCSGLNALRALALLDPDQRAALAAAIENLQSPSASQRANALEILETAPESQTIRPLIELWEPGDSPAAPLPESWLEALLADPDPWLRACAVLATPLLTPSAGLSDKINALSHSDPDETVRATAESVVSGERPMETLPTLSIMERILFLRRVPLFAGLQGTELKQVAAIASEILFADGQALALQGEVGAELFIIITGEVRVLVAAAGQDEPREFTRRRSGDYVGEMAVISQEPRMATLVANGPVRVLCIQQKQFESMLRERPEIGLAMMRTLSQRLKEATHSAVEASA